MSEPEELILEGAHVATRVARDMWRRLGPAQGPDLALRGVRVRLELFLAALFGTAIAIRPMEPPAPATWLSRVAHRRPRMRHDPRRAGTDGQHVFLPPALDCDARLGPAHGGDALALYQLLAVQQAFRLVRGTVGAAATAATPAIRDLLLLAEASAIDRRIAVDVPGLLPVLKRVRADALSGRGAARPGDPDLERLVRTVLSSDPGLDPLELGTGRSAARSLEWARDAAGRKNPRGPYRGVPSVWYWGGIVEAGIFTTTGGEPGEVSGPDAGPRPPRVAEMRRRPRPRQAPEDEDDRDAGTWVIRADDPQESVEDPLGLQRPVDTEDEPDVDGLGDSLSDLPEARVVRTPGKPRDILYSGEWDVRRTIAPGGALPRATGIAYPEWDYRVGGYRQPGAIVRESEPGMGDAAWVAASLSRHARLARRVRTRFERLRPRPLRLLRQLEGTDIDIAAYVTGAADRRAGLTTDDRVYAALRPARRELAVALLLDVSASTDAWVSTDRRIVDVEKEAMLIVCEALEALGDRYGLYAFSGEGGADVAVSRLKRFDEPAGMQVRRRIAALDADRYTRLGAPIRHITAALCRQAAAARLLLLLSDGKPNDVDEYEGRYGIEDTRQAVAEARRQGVSVFCLTVDREAPGYAARIFGRSGFAVLHRAEQLPAVVVDVLRELIRA